MPAPVLIVTPRYPPLLGGMERECWLLAREYASLGWRPVVITELLGQALPTREDKDGVRVIRVPSSPRRTLRVQLRVAATIAFWMLRYRNAGFAVVRTVTLPSLVAGLLKRLRLIPYPTFVTAETGGAGDDVVALAHRPFFSLSRALVSSNDVLNGLCQANVDHLLENGFPAHKIARIPNGVDTAAWEAARPPESVRRFLFLGRLDPEKGIFELADAFDSLAAERADVHLTIAGDGPAASDMRSRLAVQEAAGRVSFIGRVDYDRVGELFQATDCLVLPSYSEGMPLSILEAAAHHRVLVVSDVGDMRLLFGDSIHVCRPRDVPSLLAALRSAVDDPQPRAEYADVIEQVDIGNVARSIAGRLGAVRD